MFYKKGLNDFDKRFIISSLLPFVKSGKSLAQALKNVYETESDNKKLHSVIKSVIRLIDDQGVTPEDALYSHKIIDMVELTALRNSTSLQNTLTDILSIKKIKGSSFERRIISSLAFPVIALAASLALFVISKPYADDFVQMAAAFGGKSLGTSSKMFTEKYIEYPFLLQNRLYPLGVLILFIGLCMLTVFWYKDTYSRNTKVIYKRFRRKAYDDIPVLFSLMSLVQKSGKTTKEVFDVMSVTAMPTGLRPMFRGLVAQMSSPNSKEEIYKAFEKNGFPKEICLFLKTAEHEKDIWKNNSEIIQTALDKRAVFDEVFVRVFEKPMVLLGYAIIVLFMFQMVLFAIQMIGLIMSSQRF